VGAYERERERCNALKERHIGVFKRSDGSALSRDDRGCLSARIFHLLNGCATVSNLRP